MTRSIFRHVPKMVPKRKFNFTVPKARYKEVALQGPKEAIVVLKKIRTCPRETTLGQMNRRHIKTGETIRGAVKYEHFYHATKGWRTRSEPA